ncbi:hypothetical protein [Streptoalloteichus hindustanus]|uniref:ABC-2 family transporter protein n=1 Tax=Streptoalloteichus hindustanus TaxID=2017 RepID=A0A1M5AWT1_STRHI|nr:hypothetical protein [Streptoalloteichus hindustanus]SHF34741.1 hypothetical protein SAMN05444320_103294 [Streptoalloteichus hindustanus]
MIWLAWRQHRAALCALGVYVLAVVALMVYYRSTMLAEVDARHVWNCLPDERTQACLRNRSYWQLWAISVPAARNVFWALAGYMVLAGVFAGAPAFGRELEQGTHLLALSQSVRPRRWFFVKLGMVAVPALLGAVVLGLVRAWWVSSLGDLMGARERFQPGQFEVQPLTMVGYTVFALALGVACGLLVRRVVPAMALTLVGAVGVMYVVGRFLRPHYRPPVVGQFDRAEFQTDRARWSLRQDVIVDLAGGDVDGARRDAVLRACDGPWGSRAFEGCLVDHGLRLASFVHPGHRFWLFQGIEFGLFALLAGVLVAVAVWLLRRRMS